MTLLNQTALNQTVFPPDEEQIRAVIDAWGESSAAGDLTAQLNLMTRRRDLPHSRQPAHAS